MYPILVNMRQLLQQTLRVLIMIEDVKKFIDQIDPDVFLDQFLSLIEEQKVCEDFNDVCDVRLTSFGRCCVKCGILPDFWEGDGGEKY